MPVIKIPVLDFVCIRDGQLGNLTQKGDQRIMKKLLAHLYLYLQLRYKALQLIVKDAITKHWPKG